jgi:GntR family transcriptional regulator
MDTGRGAALDFSGVRLHGYDRWPYEQIAAVIEEAIASGKLRPRDPVPSEKHIVQVTGASRWAVRHAIAHLRDKGLLYTVPHLGTFVSPPPG